MEWRITLGGWIVKTSIIIVNYNSRPYLKSCLASLLAWTKPPFEIIVVDNQSTDDSRYFLGHLRHNTIKIIYAPSNQGFAKACNQGLEKASGHLLVTMNPDVLVANNWLERLAWHLKQNPRTLMVGPQGLGIGGPQFPGLIAYPSKLEAADRKFATLYHRQSKRAKFLIGCLALFDRRLLQQVGEFDENFYLGADDFDVSLRIRKAGYELRVARDVLIRHFVHASFNRSQPEACQKLALASWDHFHQKWSKELREIGWKRLFEDDIPVFPEEKPFTQT
jgi:O-antigen biosynthesis protein